MASKRKKPATRPQAAAKMRVAARSTVAPPAKKNGTPAWMAPYLAAAWGIRNHWWPALFSSEVGEDEVKPVRIAGEHIVLRRAKGKVYALKDECVHRGVRLSLKPTCLTKDSLTCWYHGFTYNLDDGRLMSIVAAPDDPIIGKVRLQTYPVQEANDIVFVFVGDPDVVPPPLAHDLPHRIPEGTEHRTAYLLDPDTVALGIHRKCVGDWRLAAESGGDPGHILIHRHSALVLSQDIGLALGEKKRPGATSITVQDKGYPVGVTKLYENMDFVMENKALNIKARGTKPPIGVHVSLYLPGVLLVENWPMYGYAQMEWYVPIDDHHHEYWQVLVKTCRTDDEREDFQIRFEHAWRDLALKGGFNDDDIWSREAMEAFYANGRGWEEEKLFSLDEFIVHWRRLFVKHARGIQQAPR